MKIKAISLHLLDYMSQHLKIRYPCGDHVSSYDHCLACKDSLFHEEEDRPPWHVDGTDLHNQAGIVLTQSTPGARTQGAVSGFKETQIHVTC